MCHKLARPVSDVDHLTSELWAARLGHCGVNQLSMIPRHANGTPSHFHCHPLRFVDIKEEATIKRQPRGTSSPPVLVIGCEFNMDFGFLRASSASFGATPPVSSSDRIVWSYDGFCAYLAISCRASRRSWVFPRKSKEPPVDLIRLFLAKFGCSSGGSVRCDQGGELARSEAFRSMCLSCGFVVEPTGADSPSQNGGVERLNGTLAATVRALLYGAGLPPQYWSAALTHASYLHNRRVHSAIRMTPYEFWHGTKPDLSHLRVFGSRVMVKKTGKRDAKLDLHAFHGVFIGYTATDKNVRYIDINSGLVKSCHHAVFDEAWYTQPRRPPTAQLLYSLGLRSSGADSSTSPDTPPGQFSLDPTIPDSVSESQSVLKDDTGGPSSENGDDKMALRCPESSPSPPTEAPQPLVLEYSGGSEPPSGDSSTDGHIITPSQNDTPPVVSTEASGVLFASRAVSCSRINMDAKVVHDFDITHRDLCQVYFSPSPYDAAFEETYERKYITEPSLLAHRTGGFVFQVMDNRCLVSSILPGSIFARIPRWRSRIRGAWLVSIDGIEVSSEADVCAALSSSLTQSDSLCVLLFSHPEIRHGLTNDGIPQISVDQLNPRSRHGLGIPSDMMPPTTHGSKAQVVTEDDSRSYTSNATRLTRGRLLRQVDWDEWREAEHLQWDQYEKQGMLGKPCPLPPYAHGFNIVWQYAQKHDGRKKARATCDGSTRGNVVRVLDHTYANTSDHIGQRLFYSVCAAENFVIFGSDAANAFAEANPPRQGIHLIADASFRDWWIHKGRDPLPPGWVIPLRSAMQGHPESPRLWERHIDGILRKIGLTATTHEPCLYSGLVNGARVLLLRQVDDFAVGAADGSTCDQVFDLIDGFLKIPLKRLGQVTMYNGVNVTQTKHYIKISCESYIDKISERHMALWMQGYNVPLHGATPLPTTSGFMKSFLSAVGVSDNQAELEHRMKFSYRSAVGELIYALVTCRPDISPAVVRCSQACVNPHEIHFHAVKHVLKYLYLTKSEGLYFWRGTPNDHFPDVPPPTLASAQHDLLMDGRPDHDGLSLHGYVDSDWATCPKTRRSMTGICVRLAGGTIAWKTKLQPTVAQSSTEAEFMGASDFGKIMLYIQSILWDLGIPQVAASIMYEDNDACTAMAMAQKPTPRTRHMDIKFYALCEWVERDLLRLERIDTCVNLGDHFTKALPPVLFRRHLDYIMGRVPPAYSKCHPVFRYPQKVEDGSTHGGMTPAVHRLVSVWKTIVDSDHI